jgi:exodeoxyribonuclease VII small subunit
MSTKKPSFHFEQSLQELDALVNKLEDGELSLEESLTAFERGISLTRECQQHLADAKQKVSMLIGKDSDLQLVSFDTPEAE